MCEVEVTDSGLVEADADHFTTDMGVPYDQYGNHYEEVTCETEEPQGLMMQDIEDGEYGKRDSGILESIFTCETLQIL